MYIYNSNYLLCNYYYDKQRVNSKQILHTNGGSQCTHEKVALRRSLKTEDNLRRMGVLLKEDRTDAKFHVGIK